LSEQQTHVPVDKRHLKHDSSHVLWHLGQTWVVATEHARPDK